MGFPAVLKPTGGAASIGVLRVDSMEELLQGFQRVRSEMSRSVVDGSGVLMQARRCSPPAFPPPSADRGPLPRGPLDP